MLKKTLSFIIIVGLFIFMAGCGTSKSTETELQNKTGTEASNKTEQTNQSATSSPAEKQIQSDTNTVAQQANVVNNSKAPNYTETGEYLTANTYILTEDDLQKALSQLVKNAYLTGAEVNEITFRTALSQYQKDQGLNPTGQLDGETFAKLTAK